MPDSNLNDVWTVKPASNQPLPVGGYLAQFVSVTDHALPSGESRWRWVWRVMTGEYANREASALTQRDIKPATHAGLLIAGLLGRTLQPGERVQDAILACTGKVYLVTVSPGPKGGKPGVRSVAAAPQM